MQKNSATTLEARKTAQKSGLRYISDDKPGIKRVKKGNGFSYYSSEGSIIKDDETLDRIKKLVLPPAWQNVWISPYADSHLQATGSDVKGRKQYKYHTHWSHVRSRNKFSRMRAFANALPKIRKAVEHDIARRNISKEKVMATVVQLMEKAHIRVGNEEYRKENGSFGLTTLRDKHVEINGSKLKFEFKGKKGIWQEIELTDKRLARIVQKCKDIPGQELFQYYDEDGKRHSIDSGAVNDYLQQITGDDFTAKDFRTWAGTLHAFNALWQLPPTENKTARKQQLVDIVKDVSRRLGNTPSVCRKYYIHPALLQLCEEDKLSEIFGRCKNTKSAQTSLAPEECMLVNFLEVVEKI